MDTPGLIAHTLKSIRDTRLTYFIVLTGAVFIGIIHLLPKYTQTTITNLIRTPAIFSILITIIFIIGYFNIIGGIIILILFTCLLLPVGNPTLTEIHKEGFTDKEEQAENGLDSNNKVIKDLLKPGKLRKELDEARKVNKDLFEREMANNKFLEYEYNKKKKNTSSSNNKKEKFQADLDSGNARSIQQRKFNPANQEDVNLLTSMEIFDDIRDRIKYNYEDKKYLKRYIKEKLEEIVDMLDLVPAE
jgi:MFS superfamily sulfate permease-like transporter